MSARATRAAQGGAAAPTLADMAKIVELRTKVVSMSSLAVGTLWAAAGGAFSWPTFALMLKPACGSLVFSK